MSAKELTDNLTFLSALGMLGQLREKRLLSPAETDSVEALLRERLRPTVLLG